MTDLNRQVLSILAMIGKAKVQDSINLFSEIIQKRDLLQLIGQKENLWFEVKEGSAYDLNSPSGRYELAKDVSALANAEGGYIIIGLKSEPLIKENTDIVIELDLISKKAFPVSQYKGIINEYIHPKIRDIKIGWVEDINSQGLGIGYIFVPNQEENKKFFLIKNIMEEGEQIKEIVFGIAQRVGSSNAPLTFSQLYQIFQKGRSPLTEMVSRIEDKINLMLVPKGRVDLYVLRSFLEHRDEELSLDQVTYYTGYSLDRVAKACELLVHDKILKSKQKGIEKVYKLDPDPEMKKRVEKFWSEFQKDPFMVIMSSL